MDHPIVIIGAGIAGLSAALRLAPHPVTIITFAPLGEGSASAWAQGGIAAALAEDDEPVLHVTDTVAAGAGLVNAQRATFLAENAPAQIAWLEKIGVPFDKAEGGGLSLGREAAHSRHRIAHAGGGDGTGAAVMKALLVAAHQAPHIQFHVGHRAVDIAMHEGAAIGVHLAQEEKTSFLPARAVLLATGGIGQLYIHTTNPGAACGEGLAMAARAGAVLSDLEFIQFHPTALAIGRDPMPLLTEALRGEGATLINEMGTRFMLDEHASAELAPRDVVARAIWKQLQAGHKPMLDARKALGTKFAQRFPIIYDVCMKAGLNPETEPLPVAPAAHYHMGGALMDDFGRTNVKGLWVCGETACSHIHGANRLASNSLLEALVYSEVVAKALPDDKRPAHPPAPKPYRLPQKDDQNNQATRLALRRLMYAEMGLLRHAHGMGHALKAICGYAGRGGLSSATRSMLLLAGMMTLSALRRHESRGAHARRDYPALATRAVHSQLTLKEFKDGITLETGLSWPEEETHV